jgi:hypothetical protein
LQRKEINLPQAYREDQQRHCAKDNPNPPPGFPGRGSAAGGGKNKEDGGEESEENGYRK